MTMPTLHLIRHGEIRANATGRWHGATDSPLTAAGRRQAGRTAVHLANVGFEAIYSSPLKRCLDTARALARVTGQAVHIDDDLREFTIGELEDTPFRVLHAELDFFTQLRDDSNYAPRGGESLNAVAVRMARALRRIHAHHESALHVAVVSHGAALAIALASLLHDDPQRWTEFNVANCSVTELTLLPQPLIGAFNRTDHL